MHMHAYEYLHIHTHVSTRSQVEPAEDTKFCLIHASGQMVKLRAESLADAHMWVTKLASAAKKVRQSFAHACRQCLDIVRAFAGTGSWSWLHACSLSVHTCLHACSVYARL